MDAPTPQPAPQFKPMTLALAGLGLVLTVALTATFARLPTEHSAWNVSVIGALALFAAARLGFWPGLAFAVLAIALKDLTLYLLTPWWEPYPLSWVYFAGYALAGWALLRRSASVGRIAGTALGVSLAYFAVSNFVSWLEQALPYGYSLQGLLNCYVAGLPFYRGTFFGDMLFTGALFGAHAALSRAYFPAERVQPVVVEDARETW